MAGLRQAGWMHKVEGEMALGWSNGMHKLLAPIDGAPGSAFSFL